MKPQIRGDYGIPLLDLSGAIPFEVPEEMLWFYLSILTEELQPPQLPHTDHQPCQPHAGASLRAKRQLLSREIYSTTTSRKKRILDQDTALSKHIFQFTRAELILNEGFSWFKKHYRVCEKIMKTTLNDKFFSA